MAAERSLGPVELLFYPGTDLAGVSIYSRAISHFPAIGVIRLLTRSAALRRKATVVNVPPSVIVLSSPHAATP